MKISNKELAEGIIDTLTKSVGDDPTRWKMDLSEFPAEAMARMCRRMLEAEERIECLEKFILKNTQGMKP